LGGIKTGLYRWHEISGEPFVALTEGEKDCEAGAEIGLPTCTSGGVGSWREDHAKLLAGKTAFVIADADDAGRSHAQKVAASLHAHGAEAFVVELPDAKDLAAWIAQGHTAGELWRLLGDVKQWKPANGAELLDDVMAFIRRFVCLSESQARAVTLWVCHTHATDAADCTPYLSITSAEKQSGKTRLLEILRPLVLRPWFTGRATAAVLIRKVDAEKPTLLLDESDAAFSGDKEYGEALRGILNSGYRRGGKASCCVGQGANINYRDFSTFCPKMIAGIGKLPDTVSDRSVPIKLKRARRGEVERFREREVSRAAGELQGKLAAWAQTNLETLRDARPEIPGELSDRQADTSEALLAIADLAGGDWATAARRALVELCAGAQADDDSIGVKLLTDIKRALYPQDDDGKPLPRIERMASQDLAAALGEMEARPWAEWGRAQKPITRPQLARLLSRFDIRPKTVRLSDGRRLKGYEREQFEECWTLYLPPDAPVPPCPNRDTVTSQYPCASEPLFHTVTPEPCHASENAVSPSKNAGCHGVTDRKRGQEDEREVGNDTNSNPDSNLRGKNADSEKQHAGTVTTEAKLAKGALLPFLRDDH
jgi:hypothetical protein